MIGWRSKEGFHIILEGQEGVILAVLLGEGVKSVKKWKLSDKKLKQECIAEALTFYDKISVMFISDNYNPSSEKRKITARFNKPLVLKNRKKS
jgi:hypothetical protein